MNLINVYLAQLYLFFNIGIKFFFIHDASERLLYFLACLHNLSFNQPVVHAPILLYFKQYSVFLIDPVQITIFNISKRPLPVLVHRLRGLDFPLLHIYYLPYVKDVFYAGLDIPNELLRYLDLLVDRLGRESSDGLERGCHVCGGSA
jgi:hypothetical protein